MSNKYARHDAHTLRVTKQDSETVHHIGLGALRKQRASIVAQRDRDAARYASELAEVDEMIEACQVAGITEPLKAAPLPATLNELMQLPELPKLPLLKRIWAFLKKPRML